MFKKLRNKLLIINMLIIAALVICCLAAIQITTSSFIKSDINARLDRAAAMCRNAVNRNEARAAGEFDDEDFARPDGRQMRNGMQPPEEGMVPSEEARGEDRFSTEISVYCDKDANVLLSEAMFNPEEVDYGDKLVKIIASDKTQGSVNLDVDSWAYRREEYGEGYIIAFTKNEAEKKIILTLNIMLAAAAIFSIGISFLISLLSANRSIRPIEEAYNKQKQFVADASHELRTPLASISANTDVLLSKRGSTIDEEYKWLEYIKDEAERMTQLTNDLLCLARSDSDEGEKVYPEISLSDTVEDVILETEAVAFESGVAMSDDIAEGITVCAPQAGLKQLVLILVDNAIKYTPQGGSANISLKRENGKAVLRVENDGEINKEDLPHIFERFYRADKSRARESGGYGLGLSIAESLCRSIGGRIKAESENGRTRFTVTI